ncbi:MAG: hypothetical protein DRG30_09145 [Epsilonproteobacteria bacterium]|nr:MAG: hypothetical protein DRG30_09145 [Campylobacterota bacterium]
MKKIEKFIFIITYGRSGSTVLMKVLNTIDGAEIKGENANALFPLFQSYKYACAAKDHEDENSLLVDHPWYGANEIDTERYARKLTKVFIEEILNPNEATRVLGFKEIRYADITNLEKLEEFVKFIRIFFPNSYIIFNRRNLEDVLKSAIKAGWWKNLSNEKILDKHEKFDRWMVKYSNEHPDFTYIVSYDDYKDNSDAYREMFDFIDEDRNEEKVKEVMSKKLTHLK